MGDRRVLVTNDDGPHAAGLATLARAATAAGWDVVVAVPARDTSSAGTAVGTVASAPVEVRRTPQGRFEVSAFPAAIVTLAMTGAFGPVPDLVLAGVNHGANVGRGLVHSSTVGAALTAAVHGAPGVAFSAARGGPAGWEPVLTRLVEALPERWPPDGCLSVNLPERPTDDVVWCRPAASTALGELVASGDRIGVRYRPLGQAPPADTDAGALARGRIALTWLTLPYADPADPAWQAAVLRRLRAPQAALSGGTP